VLQLNVTPKPPRHIAFQFDGTQQAIDNLNAALGPNSLNIAYVDADTWEMTPPASGTIQAGLSVVYVFEVPAVGDARILTDYTDLGAFLAAWDVA